MSKNVNIKLSRVLQKIRYLMFEADMSYDEEFELYTQMSIKMFIRSTQEEKNPKEMFLAYVEDLYDSFEELANTMNII